MAKILLVEDDFYSKSEAKSDLAKPYQASLQGGTKIIFLLESCD